MGRKAEKREWALEAELVGEDGVEDKVQRQKQGTAPRTNDNAGMGNAHLPAGVALIQWRCPQKKWARV